MNLYKINKYLKKFNDTNNYILKKTYSKKIFFYLKGGHPNSFLENIQINSLNSLKESNHKYIDFNNKYFNKLKYFSQKMSYLTCVLSQIVYKDMIVKEIASEIQLKINDHSETLSCISIKNINFMIVYDSDNKVLFIVFKGTDSIENVRTVMNISYVNTDIFPGKIHAGFYEGYMQIRDVLFNLINKILNTYDIIHIVLTGHSIGGVFASLCAIDFKKNLNFFKQQFSNIDISVYTFGSPKVGDKTFKINYDLLVPYTYRFVNSTDIVATTIIQNKLFAYHVGILIQIIDPNIVDYNSIPTNMTLIDSLKSIAKNVAINVIQSIPVHFLDYYLEGIISGNFNINFMY